MVNDELIALRRVSAELFERSSRVRRYLDLVGPGDSGEYRQLARTIREALEAIEASVVDSFGALRQLSLFSSPDGLQAVCAALNRYSRWFVRVHELLVYLPREHVSPETFSALRESFDAHYEAHGPSIILGSLFNALEFDFVDILEERIPDLRDVLSERPKNIVLQLAICDWTSPLAWSILAHEMGHAIDHERGLSAAAVRRFSRSSEPIRSIIQRWSGEIAADLIAAAVLGPAPMLALLSIGSCLLPLRPKDAPSETHPPMLWRARIVRDLLGDDGLRASLLAETNAYRQASKSIRNLMNSAQTAGDSESEDPLFKNVVVPVADHLMNALSSLDLPRFNSKGQSLARCQARLSRELPVGAQGLERGILSKSVAEFVADPPDDDVFRRQKFHEIVDSFREEPVDMGVILSSGFSRRAELIDRFCQHPPSDEADAAALCAELHRLDELLASSIRSSAVHRHLRR